MPRSVQRGGNHVRCEADSEDTARWRIRLQPVERFEIKALVDHTEERQPSFLFRHSVLITREIDPTRWYEPGIPLEHFGMWFSSLQDATTMLNYPGQTSTPSDGGSGL